MNKILMMGIGGCGNKLINVAMSLLKSSLGLTNEYDFLMVNSNKNEMKSLKYYHPKIALELMGDGTGKDRDAALQSFKLEQGKIGNYFVSVQGVYDQYEIYTSADGGFGSGTCTSFCKTIRALNPTAAINVRAVMPKLNSKKINLRNSLCLYNELNELLKDKVINNIQLINNDKMKNEDNFNIQVMSQMIEATELHGGAVDNNDVLKINKGYRYRNILKLDSSINDLKEAISESVANSLFITSDISECSHICAVINKGDYNKDELYNIINHTTFDKIDYCNNNLSNTVVISGCKLPNNYIKSLENEANRLEEEELSKTEEGDSYYRAFIGGGKNKNNKIEPIKVTNINDLFPTDFWDR